MTLLLRRLFWILPVLVLGLFLLLSLIANSWLESSGGKLLLQRELAKSLGRPVRLGGAYRLKLLPRLKITGSELEIGSLDGPGVLGSAKEYSVTIDLLPFVNGEVRVVSIELLGGFIDLRQMNQHAVNEEPADDSLLQLPRLDSLTISDFQIHMNQEGSNVLIRKLQLSDFQPGQAAQLDIDAALITELTEVAHLSLQGALTVEPGSWSTQLSILDLQLKIGGLEITGVAGKWLWNRPAAHLAGQLAWVQASQSAHLQLDLELQSRLSGSLRASYRPDEQLEQSSLVIDFIESPGRMDLQRTEAEIAGQTLSGAGCVWLTEKPELHLSMQADEVDLDKIYAILPFRGGGDDELPMNLAILLQAEKVRLAGTEAFDVSIEVGKKPDCSQTDESGS